VAGSLGKSPMVLSYYPAGWQITLPDCGRYYCSGAPLAAPLSH
jgi:hypothetical protein